MTPPAIAAAQETRVEHRAASCLARLRARDDQVRAWVAVDPVGIMATARAMDAAPSAGNLHGMPIGIKDVILTSDLPTRYNTNLPIDVQAHKDAACVSQLRAAGALIFGKTETAEFGSLGRVAPTRNPIDLTRTPGGSSSGSAAAVADLHVPVCIGTQTGGSIIRPASFCGIHAFKASWGTISMEGVKSFAPSLDTLGWFAHTPEDLRRVLDAFDPAPDLPRQDRSLRIAICRTPMWDRAGSETHAAMDHHVQRYRDAGAIISDLVLPKTFDRLHEAHNLIMHTEGGRTFRSEFSLHGAALHPNLARMVRDLHRLNYDDLRHAYNLAGECRRIFDDLAAQYSGILAPSAPGEAPDIASGNGDYIFNAMWTLLHTPCVNMPGYKTKAGLPVGVTLTGPRWRDRAILLSTLN